MMKEYKSFYKSVSGNEGARCHYNTRLDTYGCGCQHNCSYCYARSLLEFRGNWHPGDPSVADISKVRNVIKRKLSPGDVVRLGGMTDCFMPIERKYGVTRETIRALNESGVGYLIVTKSPLVAEYMDVLDRKLAHVQVSITSTRDDISRKIEPGAALPGERIKAVETLFRSGFDVQIRLSPFIPEFVDTGVINSIDCDRVLVEFLRVNGFIRKWLGDSWDWSKYSYFYSNYHHLPLTEKIKMVRQISKVVSVCEDVPEHWEYWRDNVNANPNDCCNLKLI